VANVRWSGGGSKYGTDEDGQRCFEPRVEHRGELARAMLYFALRYDKEIDQKQEELFRRWNNKYAVDEVEERRNEQIDELQHNRNPFVDIPEFVELISDF
jgi:endonuclease I